MIIHVTLMTKKWISISLKNSMHSNKQWTPPHLALAQRTPIWCSPHSSFSGNQWTSHSFAFWWFWFVLAHLLANEDLAKYTGKVNTSFRAWVGTNHKLTISFAVLDTTLKESFRFSFEWISQLLLKGKQVVKDILPHTGRGKWAIIIEIHC